MAVAQRRTSRAGADAWLSTPSVSRRTSRSGRRSGEALASGECGRSSRPRRLCSPICCSRTSISARKRSPGWLLEPHPSLKYALPSTAAALFSCALTWWGVRASPRGAGAQRALLAFSAALLLGSALRRPGNPRLAGEAVPARHFELCIDLFRDHGSRSRALAGRDRHFRLADSVDCARLFQRAAQRRRDRRARSIGTSSP